MLPGELCSYVPHEDDVVTWGFTDPELTQPSIDLHRSNFPALLVANIERPPTDDQTHGAIRSALVITLTGAILWMDAGCLWPYHATT